MERSFDSIEQILDFAIEEEIKANKFYLELAEKAERPAMQRVFKDFADEEQMHKEKLEDAKQGRFELKPGRDVQTLGIAECIVDVEPRADMSYADALILAMKKEKAAYRLYLDLAAVAQAEEFTDLFLNLAQEEAKHKLQFEIEYDDMVAQQEE